ncbi:uncharacterized protein LOC122501742 [Leptopilina heterotoma]|uniref:uncharacterized protein LOC122501742 n=1 Tax=Leptopilina heterotoma TaxID=63436 RepID=UPI001CA97DFE|nr:uncharacterized protein LOC122501742 [Leptopilina heterotoma]
MRVGKVKVSGQGAILQETDLGWIFSGRYTKPNKFNSKIDSIFPTTVQCNLIKYQDIPPLWELESDKLSKNLSDEEKIVEEHCNKTTKRLENGSYQVNLPFNDKKEILGDSRNTAFQRFYALERKFEKYPEFHSSYCDIIQNYLDEGHLTAVDSKNDLKGGYFLPHHAVTKVDSCTTRDGVVFDGSTKTSSGVSLNEALRVGPTIQDNIYAIIARFRLFPYALSADIRKMYRQILGSPKDEQFQKILWRSRSDQPIEIYSLNRVTFGTACAPYLAIRTLHQLADDEQREFPIAAHFLKNDFYVDDFLSSAKTLQDALDIRNELITLLSKGGFTLRKWVSNDPRLCENFVGNISDEHMSLDPSNVVKTLGLRWNPTSDEFLYIVNLENTNEIATKRSVLSKCAKLYDPLGILGPVIVVGKLLIQQLWKLNLEWNEPLPKDLQIIWKEYVD